MGMNVKKAQDMRCECGSLIARVTDKGVEIKCRRCKRLYIIPLPKIKREVM